MKISFDSKQKLVVNLFQQYSEMYFKSIATYLVFYCHLINPLGKCSISLFLFQLSAAGICHFTSWPHMFS